MESQTTETANEKREWSVKKHNCQDGLDILKPVIPIITRVQTWINYLQNTRSPTVSLLIYIMKTLLQFVMTLLMKLITTVTIKLKLF